ncbi:hypothetical protein AXF14_05920 [Actinomyces radicidentis]|uniref:DUF2993 domain-containing protein n=1 Tax=Actinomyces radicidentis TaxID=111015 RepID=A0A0X8JEL4_ACTRD|nr:DUF2993 domain-containing protein [Actinomyces radicidentis]AMD87206.1 hypothetical protein AXF14_05920 [Actinomyces radicidentis]
MRRGRRALSLLLVLVLLAAACVVGELYARSRVAATVRDAVPGLSADASVTTQGLVLPQLLGGELDSLDVDASSLELDSSTTGGSSASDGTGAVTTLELSDVDASLTGLGVRAPHRAGALAATGTVSWDSLAALVAAQVPDLPALSLARAGSTDDLTASATVLGVDVALTLAPSASDAGGIDLEVTGASLAGQEVDLVGEVGGRTLASWLGLSSTTISVPADALPDGLTVSRAAVADDGLRLTLAAQDLALDSLGS